MTNNNGILIVIAVALIGILTVMFLQYEEKPPGEKIADSIGELTEEIGDEIDDHTKD